MAKKKVNRAARSLGKRSATVRREKMGRRAFVEYMRELGKRGGRPKKDQEDR